MRTVDKVGLGLLILVGWVALTLALAFMDGALRLR